MSRFLAYSGHDRTNTNRKVSARAKDEGGPVKAGQEDGTDQAALALRNENGDFVQNVNPSRKGGGTP